jgi:NADPH2:quinone reductase
MSESCVTINIIVIIMKLWNCLFSVIKSKEFLLLWIERREEPEGSTNESFNVVASGKVRINVNQRFALKDAADAHKALGARATSGSSVLTIEPAVHRSCP